MPLALDWDGTCTVLDSLVEAVRIFGDPAIFDERFGSYGESLAAEVGTIRATAQEVEEWAAAEVRLSPGCGSSSSGTAP